MNMPEFADIDIVFDATSAGAHVKNDAALREAKPDIRLIDLTPAAIGPYCVPVVNLEANVDQLNVNMVTCGGQGHHSNGGGSFTRGACSLRRNYRFYRQ